VRVKGRAAPVEIFTVPLDAEARAIAPAWLAAHEEGWQHYRAGGFAEAMACFETVAEADCAASAMMASRSRALIADPPGPGWDAVVNLDSK